MSCNTYKTAIIRKCHFNAAHRLHNATWTDEKNQRIFGKCNNPNYHGHNYDLEVKIIGPVDPETGFVMDVKFLKEMINKHVIEKYDHKNLNLDVDDFREVIPTAENIARVIFDNLRPQVENSYDLKIKLYETERNCVEYPA